MIKKDDMASQSAIRFRARTAANATAGFYAYGSTPGFDGNVTRRKLNTHFVTAYVEVSVEDEEIEFAKSPGGMGDVYADEIKWSTRDLMTSINQDLLTGATASAENQPWTFETTILGSTGTLYGRNIANSGYTTLQSAGKDDMSSAPITLKKMRAMIRACVQNGARKQDLVFICDHLQEDFIKGLIQDMQRITPTSGRVGFTGNIELDGVPIFADVDCNTDDLFLTDTAHTKIGMKLPPMYEELGKQGDSRRGIIKTYFNLYSTAPNHNYWIYGLAIS